MNSLEDTANKPFKAPENPDPLYDELSTAFKAHG